MSTLLERDALAGITQDVWSSFLGEEPLDEAAAAPAQGASVTGCVTISGGWSGSVLLTCTQGLASHAAAGLFAADAADLTPEEIADAVGELTNMVGGTVKNLLPGPSKLSLPSVTTGSSYTVTVTGASLVAQVSFAWAGEPLTVTVWEG
jgi:chemotaxis protein CheX